MKIQTIEKKKEAIKRMKRWGIYKDTITHFDEEDKISKSSPPFGACYWIEGEQLNRIRKFEEEYNALVYHVIHNYTNFGEMESYLYVSDHKDEWEDDMNQIEQGIQMAYVHNLTVPDDSEFGYIGIKRTPAHGLTRVF